MKKKYPIPPIPNRYKGKFADSRKLYKSNDERDYATNHPAIITIENIETGRVAINKGRTKKERHNNSEAKGKGFTVNKDNRSLRKNTFFDIKIQANDPDNIPLSKNDFDPADFYLTEEQSKLFHKLVYDNDTSELSKKLSRKNRKIYHKLMNKKRID